MGEDGVHEAVSVPAAPRGSLPHLLGDTGASRGLARKGHAVALQDLLHVFHHRLMAEPEMQLQGRIGPGQLGRAHHPGWRAHPSSRLGPHLLLQHVFPLLPHAPHQPRQLRDPTSSLHLLHSRVEQREGSCAAHPGAAAGRGCEASPGAPRGGPLGSYPHLPAVDDDRRVQGALMQVMSVHLLDEVQQVAGAVRQASAGWGGVSESDLLQGRTTLPAPQPPPRAADAQLWPCGEVEVHERALEALVPELQAQHPLHMGLGGANTAQGQAQGTVHHGLAPLGREVASHLLLKDKQGS